MMKILTYIILFLLIPLHLWAVCTDNGGGVWTTAGNEYADVLDCYNSASIGDTINVIAGDGDATWASPLTISKAIKIIGPGKTNLRLRWTGTRLFIASSVVFRISGFEFYTETSQLAIEINNASGYRVDNNKYNNNTAGTGTFVYPNMGILGGQVHGLIDNNEIVNGRIVASNGNAGMTIASGLWFDDLNLGTIEAVYVEDNIITASSGMATNSMDANRGGKYVFRYNSVTQSTIAAHSLQDTSRGTRKWESYGNTFNSLDTSSYAAHFQRSGTGVIFGNDFTSVVDYNYSILFDNVRTAYTNTADNTTYAGKCDGDHNFDGNQDATGWPCRDQIGRSKDTTQATVAADLTGNSQESAPVYLWSNYRSGSAVTAYVKAEFQDHIKPNRDYYDYNTGFNGTTGTGCGTLAARPATCTTGVGYWATNQSCSDLTGMIGVNPATPISGTLYKCTAPDTWTVYYTPYIYPHPLRGEGGGDPDPPIVVAPYPLVDILTPTSPVDTALLVSTDENATCKYDTSDVAYDSMANTYSATGGVTSHVNPLSLAWGNYIYYARCMDGEGNKNTSSTIMTFSIRQPITVTLGSGPHSITKGTGSATISW